MVEQPSGVCAGGAEALHGGTSGRDGASAPAGGRDCGALTGRGKKQHPRHQAQHRGGCYQDFQAEQVFHPLSSTQTRPFL